MPTVEQKVALGDELLTAIRLLNGIYFFYSHLFAYLRG
jgi:hypothetical protein